MLKFKTTEKANILSGRTITYVASKIGVTREFLTSVLNGKRNCSKPIAYCIVKCLSPEAEIEDYFEKKGE
jgi:plasmid maintenance system antidote protein VapI